MTRGAVFTGAGRLADTGGSPGRGYWSDSHERGTNTQPQRFQLRKGKPADRTRYVSESVTAGIAIEMSVAGWPNPEAIEDNNGGSARLHPALP
jgi:hypothetical protein